MQTQKYIVLVMGILVTLFILTGCSANPTSSTETVYPANNNYSGADNIETEPPEDDDIRGGYDTEPSIDIPKYEEEEDNEPLPTDTN
jgi:hypothetical protein